VCEMCFFSTKTFRVPLFTWKNFREAKFFFCSPSKREFALRIVYATKELDENLRTVKTSERQRKL
jgi:hypothetical protein